LASSKKPTIEIVWKQRAEGLSRYVMEVVKLLCWCLINMADTVSWTSPKRHMGIDKTSTAAEPS